MTKRFTISIYDYAKSSDFLRDTFNQIKKERPSYSIRAWSKQLQTNNPTSLARILSDERRIPKAMIPVICKALDLDPNETAYFELLAIGKEGFIFGESFETLRTALQKKRQEV
jgi:uncharacterized protein (TIGR02147 family)